MPHRSGLLSGMRWRKYRIMISFVNAKINIGLSVVRRRPDGYHDLETVFYPVGTGGPRPEQPDAFGDIIEIIEKNGGESSLVCIGDLPDCGTSDNLVMKAITHYGFEYRRITGRDALRVDCVLEKHLPFGAGLGGGSADASFTLLMLDRLNGCVLGKDRLRVLALGLGADCPFFIDNVPSFAEGRGECLTPVALDLSGCMIVIVKPPFGSSTKEAFAGIRPASPRFDLRQLADLPRDMWITEIVNDFEASLFPSNPDYVRIKETLYGCGAFYASLSGSGSALYGLFHDREAAMMARNSFDRNIYGVWLLNL